ncbi:MAG: glycosyltransferase family 4 protein [Candidatus Heimdallarchaeaceae archaeon]
MRRIIPHKKINVSFIAPSILFGGAERWMLNLAKFCNPASISWNICLITDHWCDKQMLYAMAELMPTYYNKKLYVKNKSISYTLDKAVKKLNFYSDVVIGWEFDKNRLELVDTKKVKVINVAHRNNPALCRKEHYLAAVSDNCSEVFGNDKKDKVKIIYNGIDLNRCFQLQNSNYMRDMWECKKSDIVIGYVGRIDPVKNCEALARAVKGLDNRAKGIIYGPKAFDALLIMKKINDLVGDRVKVFEPVEDIGSVLNAFDVFFLPSYTEAFSLSLLEAWASGIPVVATRVGAVPYLESKFGKLVIPIKPDDSEKKLARAIFQALEKPNRTEIVSRAQKMVIRNFNVYLMANRWTEYIISVSKSNS